MIKDSGCRTNFSTGAVRDIEDGKGRCDLMPLDVVAINMNDDVLGEIAAYQTTNCSMHLYDALNHFLSSGKCPFRNAAHMYLEVAKHFDEGAKKYGEHNWEKGIPEERYIDSAVRHYLKWLDGQNDESHDRAFVWNVICLIWTHEHLSEKGEGDVATS